MEEVEEADKMLNDRDKNSVLVDLDVKEEDSDNSNRD